MNIPFQIYNNGLCLLGLMHIANNQSEKPIVIVMCYGLNGNRVVQNRIALKFAKLLENNNINVIRFDYGNVGVSQGPFHKSNIANRVDDVVEICKFTQSCFHNSPINIVLIGFSDGAKIALQASKKFPVDGIILWNPVINIPVETISNSSQATQKSKLILHPIYNCPVKQLMGTGIGIEMLRQLERDSSIEVINQFEKEILLIFGENDNATAHISDYFNNTHVINKPNICYKLIKKADHLFKDSTYINDLFNETQSWLKYKFVEGNKC